VKSCDGVRGAHTGWEVWDGTFPGLRALVRGWVYFNPFSWYGLLAHWPGLKANRRFMEQMMGVKEPLPDHLVAELGSATTWERIADRLHLVRSVLALAWNHWTLPRQIKQFYVRLDRALGRKRPDLEPLRPDELAAYYRDLERQLLTKWDAPLVNDFFAMIFYGVLGKLARGWCGDADGTLQNDLLCAEGGMISAEPAARVRAMAAEARADPTLVAALCDAPLTAALGAVPR